MAFLPAPRSPLPLALLPPVALLLAGHAAAAMHPAGEVITNAAVADLTPEGLDEVAEVLPSLLPAAVALSPMSGEDWYYSYSLADAWVGIEVQDASVEPTAGVLQLRADLLVRLNDASDPFTLDYEAVWIFSGTCEGHVLAFPATLDAGLSLQVVGGGAGLPVVDAAVTSLSVSYDLSSEDIVLEDCSIADVEEVLNWFGLSLYDLILSYADAYVQDAVADAAADIEAMIEDAFSSATVDQDLDAGGVPVHLLLYPADVSVETAGVRVSLDGSLATDAPSDCVSAWDPGGSPATATSPPALGVLPSGATPGYHVGISASDDLVDQGLYALWRGGLLCTTIDDSFESFPVDTSVLVMLDGGEEGPFSALFPESAPLEIVTRPREQPLASFSGGHDVDVSVADLGLDVYAEVDHRMALALGLDLALPVGVDLSLDAASGSLAIPVDVDPAAVETTVRAAELTPGAEAAIVENFGAVLQVVTDAVVGPMLEDLAFSLPSYEGLGLVDLEAAPAGASEDWLGLFARVGEVAYTGKGCAEGCGSGCGGAPVGPGAIGLLALAALLLASRRRPVTGSGSRRAGWPRPGDLPRGGPPAPRPRRGRRSRPSR